MSFPRYSAYKDSGVAWFGEVPKHWQVAPLKAFIDRIESGVSVNATDTPAEGEQFGVLKTSCVYTGQFDAAENKAVVNAEYDRVACPVVANTLIVSRMNTPDLVGAAGLTKADHPKLFLPDRLWQVFPKDASADFMHFWTRTASYRAQVEMACAGTSSSMQNLGQDDFRSFMFVSPPPDEQAVIADFLDRETTKIDTLVAEQERLITLLKEKRQAVISHAVTKGLDPSVPMKDSRIEWLGEVPAHWQVKQLRHVARIVRGASPRPAGDPKFFSSDDSDTTNVPWVTVAEITKDDSLYLTDVSELLTPLGAEASQRFERGTVIFSNSGATLGVPKILAIDCCANDGVLAFKSLDQQVHREFLYFFLSTTTERLRTEMKQGGGQPNLNTDIVKNIGVAVPSLNEQIAIVSAVRQQTARFNDLICEAQRGVSFLQERRSALISAAVTGQIDVRGLAPAQEQAA